MVAHRPATTASLRLAGGVVDNVGIVVSGVVVVESVVVIAVVPVEVSEEANVAVRGEERGVVSDFFRNTRVKKLTAITFQASAGVVTVIVGVMESGAVAAVTEVVDAEASDI
jgi:hypothetical protein